MATLGLCVQKVHGCSCWKQHRVSNWVPAMCKSVAGETYEHNESDDCKRTWR